MLSSARSKKIKSSTLPVIIFLYSHPSKKIFSHIYIHLDIYIHKVDEASTSSSSNTYRVTTYYLH